MINGDLRCVHDDAFDIAGNERMPLVDVGERIEGRMGAADAGVEFQRHPHGLEAFAKSGGQRGKLKAVSRPREGGAETAIRRLEHVDDSGESLAC